jgi:hypothetical protein
MSLRQHEPLDLDTAFGILSNQRRRHALCVLAEREDPVELGTLAREIAARVEGTDPDSIEESTYRSVYVALYQNHVPRLADAGIVEYDADARTAKIAPNRRTWDLLNFAGIDCSSSWKRECRFAVGATAVAALLAPVLPITLFDQAWMVPVVVLISALTLLGLHQYYSSYVSTDGTCSIQLETSVAL